MFAQRYCIAVRYIRLIIIYFFIFRIDIIGNILSYRLPSASTINNTDPHVDGAVDDPVAPEMQPENEFDKITLASEEIHLSDVQNIEDVPETSQTAEKLNPQPNSSVSNETKKSAFPSSNTTFTYVLDCQYPILRIIYNTITIFLFALHYRLSNGKIAQISG